MVFLTIEDFEKIPNYTRDSDGEEGEVKGSGSNNGLQPQISLLDFTFKNRGFWNFNNKGFFINLNRSDLNIDLTINLHKIGTVKELMVLLKKIQSQPNELQFENLLLLMNDICKSYLNITLHDLLKKNIESKIIWGGEVEENKLQQEQEEPIVSFIKKIKKQK
jgi:hypothetical protein